MAERHAATAPQPRRRANRSRERPTVQRARTDG